MKKLLTLWTEFPQSKTKSSLNTFSEVLTSFYGSIPCGKLHLLFRHFIPCYFAVWKITGWSVRWNIWRSVLGCDTLNPHIFQFTSLILLPLPLEYIGSKYFALENLSAKHHNWLWALLTIVTLPFLLCLRIFCKDLLFSPYSLFLPVPPRNPCFVSSIPEPSPSAKAS